jgi:hypothetical protein
MYVYSQLLESRKAEILVLQESCDGGADLARGSHLWQRIASRAEQRGGDQGRVGQSGVEENKAKDKGRIVLYCTVS